MKKTIAIIALAAVGLGAGACANQTEEQVEQQRTERAYKHMTVRVDEALDDIEATDVQREQVHVIKDQLFDEMKGFRAKSKETREIALDQWKGDAPDADKLHGLVDERMDEMRKVMHKVVDEMIELHGVLTPEQRAEIAAEVEDRFARRMHGH